MTPPLTIKVFLHKKTNIDHHTSYLISQTTDDSHHRGLVHSPPFSKSDNFPKNIYFCFCQLFQCCRFNTNTYKMLLCCYTDLVFITNLNQDKSLKYKNQNLIFKFKKINFCFFNFKMFVHSYLNF